MQTSHSVDTITSTTTLPSRVVTPEEAARDAICGKMDVGVEVIAQAISRHYAERIALQMEILLGRGLYANAQRCAESIIKECQEMCEEIAQDRGSLPLAMTPINPALLEILADNGVETLNELNGVWPAKVLTFPKVNTDSHHELFFVLRKYGII